MMLLCLVVMGLSSCVSAMPSASATPSPSPAPDVPLLNFNNRLGNNRLAAEAATALGRRLYDDGQYWEVYVRTQPATLPDQYDPGNPAASAPAAALVTSTEILMATESGAAITAFSLGGDARERQVLAELDAIARRSFPNLASDKMRIFFGESFEHGMAKFDHGRLVSYDVRKIG